VCGSMLACWWFILPGLVAGVRECICAGDFKEGALSWSLVGGLMDSQQRAGESTSATALPFTRKDDSRFRKAHLFQIARYQGQMCGSTFWCLGVLISRASHRGTGVLLSWRF
jgi:hypothetical protein